jgi:hypothetical protein
VKSEQDLENYILIQMCTDVEKGGNAMTSLGIIVGYTILEGCSILGS